MADFARWGAAAAEAVGYGAGSFLTAYRMNASGVTEEVLEADSIAIALRRFAESRESWGPAAVSELLIALNEESTEAERQSRDWPKDATRLSKRLRILMTSLSEIGVYVTFQNKKTTEGYRAVGIRFVAPVAPDKQNHRTESENRGGSYAGASQTAAPPEFVRDGEGFAAAGAAGAGFRGPLACGYHVGETIKGLCARCSQPSQEHRP